MSASPVPLALAVPAAASFLAYLNAKWSLFYDWKLLKGFGSLHIRNALRQRRGQCNIFYDLEAHAQNQATADQEFLVYQGRSWSFKQAYDTVLKYAAWLRQDLGVQPKEIVALDFMNSSEMIFIWLALWSLGAVPAFINYNLTEKPLLHCVKVSTARLLIVDGEVRSKVTPEIKEELSSPQFRDGKSGVQVVIYDGLVESQIIQREGFREKDSARNDVIITDMAALIYTSGTTGLPKPAVVSWAKAASGGLFVAKWLNLKKEDRFYTSMPLYHSSAALLGFLTCLIHGCTIIVGHRFSTRLFWQEVRSTNATIVQYVGETLRYLLAAPPVIDPKTGENLDKKNSVRLAFGNGLRPDVWNKFKERFNVESIAEFYAATEGTSGSWNLSSNDFAAGAIGRNGALTGLLLGSRVAIVEHDHETEDIWRNPKTGLGRKVPRGEAGELLYNVDPEDIKYQFQGYFNNAKASDSKIARDVITKGDAWFRTGDLIRWDSEGRWYFSDRIGDTFRWKSENVSTSEVSEVMGAHPLIAEANVYGVQIPNHDGRAGCAATVFHNPTPSSKDLDSLAAHVTKSLPKYALPLFLRVTKNTQATGNNKQQKHSLRVEGVDPEKVAKSGDDVLYWLRDGKYIPFEKKDWDSLTAGKVKL